MNFCTLLSPTHQLRFLFIQLQQDHSTISKSPLTTRENIRHELFIVNSKTLADQSTYKTSTLLTLTHKNHGDNLLQSLVQTIWVQK